MRAVVALLALLLLALPASGAAAKGRCAAETLSEVATFIAEGHAYDKHVRHEGQFRAGYAVHGVPFPGPTISSEDVFAAFLGAILSDTKARRRLQNDRFAFWDAASGTVVIVNLGADDCGTAFRPDRGRAYFDGLR